MKKKRNLIISLLLVAAMVVGLGYAALSKELKIESSAQITTDKDSLNVIFTDAKVASATGSGVEDLDLSAVATAETTDNVAEYKISKLTQAGDTVVFEYTIENETIDAVAHLDLASSLTGEIRLGDGVGVPGVISNYFEKTIEIRRGDAGESAWQDLDDLAAPTAVEGGHKHDLSAKNISLNPSVVTDNSDKLHVRVTVKLIATLGAGADGVVDDSTVSLEGAAVYFNFSSSKYVAP